MADLITYTQYKALADQYAQAVLTISKSQTYLYDAVYDVVLYDDLLPSVDLLDPFYDVYTRGVNVTAATTGLLEAVRAVNAHVINRGGYSDINSYLGVNNANLNKLDTNWATLSSQAGYAINAAYYTAVFT